MGLDRRIPIVLFLLLQFYPLSYVYPQDQAKENESIFVAKKAFDDSYYEVSLTLLERFIMNFPDSEKRGEAELLIGRCYYYQNKLLDALETFEELLKSPVSKNLKDAIYYWIAEVYFKSGNFPKASGYYRKIIDGFPDSSYMPAALYSLGWAAFQENKYEEAKGYFEIIEKKYPNESQAKDSTFKIIESLYNMKDYPSLIERAKAAMQTFSGDKSRIPYLYFYIAEAEYYLGRFDSSLEYYLKASKEDGENKIRILSRLGLAWASLKLRRYREAESEFSLFNEENLDKKELESLLLGKGVLFTETDKATEADKIYGRLISVSSDPAILLLAYQGKAEALYSMGRYEESGSFYTKAFTKATETNSSLDIKSKLQYNLALALAKQGKNTEAIKTLQEILGGNSLFKESAMVEIGDLYQDSGDYNSAVKSYETVLKRYSRSLYKDYIKYQLGSIFLKKGDYDSTIKILYDFKEMFPDSRYQGEARYLLALAYFYKEDYDSSMKLAEELRRDAKEGDFSAKAVYLLANIKYNSGDYNKAIDIFKEIIRRSQDTELIQKAEYGIADSSYQLGNEKEALGKFKALRSKYPGSVLTADVLFWLASYYYRHNEFDLSRRYLSSLIQDFPESYIIANAYYLLGLVAVAESKDSEAEESFKKVIESGKIPLQVMAGSALGDLYYKEEKYKEALVYYRRSLNISKGEESAAFRLKCAEALEATGEIKEAIDEYLKLTKEGSLRNKAFLRLARIYEDMEDFDKAVKYYNEVLALKDETSTEYAKERIEWITANIKK